MQVRKKYWNHKCETKGDIPVVMAWFIFYVIAIVGSLTTPRPEALPPEVTVGAAPAIHVR